MSNTDTTKNTTQKTKMVVNTDTTKNTTQKTKMVVNTDTTKNTTQKNKMVVNTDTTKNTTEKTKMVINTDTTKNPGARECKVVPASYKIPAISFKYSIRVGHHYTQARTNNINKTWTLIQTTPPKNCL